MNKNYDNHTIIKETGFSMLAEGKAIRLKADGYSMYPAIKPGSVIVIEPFPGTSNPFPGDIIAWKRESGFVVHRLIRIIKKGSQTIFITRGDSCLAEDNPVALEQIAGRVISVESATGIILKTGNDLITHPVYLYNRLMVWIILKLKKISRVIHISSR